MADNEQNEQGASEQEVKGLHGLTPNWPAIILAVLMLIVVGWLLGRLVEAPDGLSLQCPEEDWVQIVGSGDHVLVYCEPPA